MNITVQHIFGQATSTVVIPLIQDGGIERPLKSIAEGSGISYELLAHDFKANFKEVHSLYITKEGAEVQRIYLLGLGKTPTFAKVSDTKEVILKLALSKRIHQIPIVDAGGKVIGIQVIEE